MTDLIRPSATGAGKTLVAVATYNEIESLPLLVEEIFRYAPDVDVLVVDDNSPDGTGAWCDERGAADARVRCLHRSGKLGLGTALVEGWQYAIAHGYHSVINLDADFSHHPRHLPELRAGVADGVDPPVEVMIGSRYVPGGRIERWPWYRRGTSRALNHYARWLLALPVRDCSGSYRCYRVDALRRVDWSCVRSQGYSILEEILWHLKESGARFCEIPITFTDRERGRSKISFRDGFAALWLIFQIGVLGRGRRADGEKAARKSLRIVGRKSIVETRDE